jgi:putative DNA primase/helicase
MDDINNNRFESNSQSPVEREKIEETAEETSIPEIVFKKKSIPDHLLEGQDYFWFYKQFLKDIKPFRKGEEIHPILVDCPFEDCKSKHREHFLIDLITGKWSDFERSYSSSGNIVDFYFEIKEMMLSDDGNENKYTAFLRVQDILKSINSAKPLTDVGNAERFVERWGDTVCFLPHRKQYMIFDGKRYALDDSGQITKLAIETMKSIYDECMDESGDKRRKKITAHAHMSQSEGKIRSLLTLSQHQIARAHNDFDKNPYLLNTQNGTIDLKVDENLFELFDKWVKEGRDSEFLKQMKPSHEIKEHDRRDMLSQISGARYDPSAKCPSWKMFLTEIFDNDEDLINFMQRAIGYSLTGDVTEQKIFFLHGTGRNGKSTFLNVIHALMGEYGQKAPMSAFLRKRADAASNDIATLCGSRFVSASEIAQGEKLNEKIIKELSGGDSFTGRFLFKEFFTFDPTFKIWLSANNLPQIEGLDFGIWRRICLIPFDVVISESEVDRKLEGKLKEELSGILNWAIKGCIDWQRDGLQEPDKVKKATDSFKTESDDILNFLDEECISEPGDDNLKVSVSDLHEKYSNWASKQKNTPIRLKKFGQKLREKGFAQSSQPVHWHGKTQRIWLGIGLEFQQGSTD